jgi:hypothetical protein
MTNRRLNYLFNTMELYLQREIFTDKSTIGTLFIDGVKECYILEDCDRGLTELMQISEIEKLKVYGETCIPYGRYEVVITMSNRFKRELPLLVGPKGFTGIRIHPGNRKEDTLGCLLTGKVAGVDVVAQSTSAFNQLFEKIKTAKSRGQKVYITIKKK